MYKFKTNLIEDDYVFGPKLGKGSYGTVYLATNIETKKQFAVKMIFVNENVVHDLASEVNNLIALSSDPNCDPNIVCYYDYILIIIKHL